MICTASSQQFGDESKEENSDLTPLERAFIASRIAEQKKFEAKVKNDKVCHQYYDIWRKTTTKHPPQKKYKPKQIQKKAKKKIKTKKEVTQIKLTLFFVKRLEIQNN